MPPIVSAEGRGAPTSPGAGGKADADSTPRVQAGKVVGRYRLLFPIAAGGMAEVWAGKPEGGISRAVAIKLVRPEFAVDAEYARMFIDEAVVASSIRHPNICETYELGRDEKLLFMVLEWVAGDSLSGLMAGSQLKRLPFEIAARICAESCAGLHAAHEATDGEGHPLGVVHRDVSPPNILVSVNGQVKVSDFGIAKAKNQLHARTRTGEIKGKLAYIPPEQMLGQGIDRRVDIYAMGCVLYVATLGLRPFGSGADALGKIVRGSYRKPRELEPNYPEELEKIVVRALSADRQQRYQTAEEMRFELEQWLLSRPRPTQHGDVARFVRERIGDERKKMIEVLVNAGREIPEALTNRLLSQNEKTQTPTATSGIVMQSAALAELVAGEQSSSHLTTGPAFKSKTDTSVKPPRHDLTMDVRDGSEIVRDAEDEATLLAPREAGTATGARLKASEAQLPSASSSKVLPTLGRSKLQLLPWLLLIIALGAVFWLAHGRP